MPGSVGLRDTGVVTLVAEDGYDFACFSDGNHGTGACCRRRLVRALAVS